MKKNRIWFILIGLFCLVTSGATVYATSYNAENHVGVRFFDSSSTIDSTTSTSSTTSSTTDSSSSSTVPSAATQRSSDLSNTDQKNDSFLWLGNTGGGGSAGGTTRYYGEDKFLPKTGELIHLAVPFVGVFLVMLVFFYLKKGGRKRV